MDYKVRLEQVPGQPLIAVSLTATLPELPKVVPSACGTVWNFIRAQNLKGAGRNVALYWDDVIHLDVGVEIDEPFVGDGPVTGVATPAGSVATTTHFGPYGGLANAHRAIHQWVASQGHALAGPSWEVYGHWKDEWNTDPSLIQTDVFYLLKAEA